MKKTLATTSVFLFFLSILSGCTAVGEKSASLAMIYGTAAVLSFLLPKVLLP